MILDFLDSNEEKYLFDKVGSNGNIKTIDISLPNNIELFNKNHNFCQFCKSPSLEVHSYRDHYCLGVDMYSETSIYECPNCGYWECINDFSEEEDNINSINAKYWRTITYAIAKKFNPSSKLLPIDTLRNELKRNPRIMHSIHPYKFEELAQSVFSDYYECEVKKVGQSHDGGIDLIIVLSDEPILVQVKRRESKSAVEQISTVRDFLGAMFIKNNSKGIILSTADHFSRTSKKIIDTLLSEKRLNFFELKDYNSFCSMINVISNKNKKGWDKLKDCYKFKSV